MIGLPMDIRPVFPKDQQVVLLTAQAAQAPELMTDIRKQLQSGRDVVITSGLLKAIPEKIAEIWPIWTSRTRFIDTAGSVLYE